MNAFPKTAVTVFGSVLLLGGLAVGGAAAPAFAHTPEVLPACDSLSLTFTSYTVIAASPASGGEPAVIADSTPNTVTVTIDGVASTAKFGTSYKKTIPLDGTAAHTWSVVLDAHDQALVTEAGSTAACVTPTPTPTTPPTATPPVPAPPTATPLVPTPPVETPPVSTTPVTTPPVAVTPPPASTPPATVTPRATATELAETGAPTGTVPGLIGALLAVVLGAGLLLTRRFSQD